MADNSYRVVPKGKNGFDVEMEKPGGRKTTVPGFRSEHEANAWIVQTKRMIRDAGPWTPLAPRKPTAKPVDEAPKEAVPASAPIEQKQVQNNRNRAASRRANVGAVRGQ
jgi:hypothetical protein